MNSHPAAPGQEGLRVLDEEECLARLAAGRLGRLAVAVGDQPHIFPVNYLYQKRSVVVRTAPGLKLEEANLSAVAFEIDEAAEDGSWGWSVVVMGPCLDVSTSLDRLSGELRKLPLQPWAPGAREHWLRIPVRQVSGRAFGKPPGAGTS
ncbi:MAG TPA: pyridoxamine 5'-phosphate oxidase family protein [Acidimicrobiales bacterium]|jgi:nitroimidazol reductase NimA-like FMN-containing flavoprotein (pyridoxamine 5'-phosphate oxidase superfamily)|nr:pyridoxamine 5'-phosphate oxidase family protein [Acidimicrobiales bacterium]